VEGASVQAERNTLYMFPSSRATNAWRLQSASVIRQRSEHDALDSLLRLSEWILMGSATGGLMSMHEVAGAMVIEIYVAANDTMFS